jgi:GNAT superfamily N-acetyltransferase
VVADGYAEWAEAHLLAGKNGAAFRMVDQDAQVSIAFAAITETATELVIDLAGVVPAHRRRGIYRRLLDELEGIAHARSKSRLSIATQLTNEAVIRSWQRRGWRETAVTHVWHLMPRDDADGPAPPRCA